MGGAHSLARAALTWAYSQGLHSLTRGCTHPPGADSSAAALTRGYTHWWLHPLEGASTWGGLTMGALTKGTLRGVCTMGCTHEGAHSLTR